MCETNRPRCQDADVKVQEALNCNQTTFTMCSRPRGEFYKRLICPQWHGSVTKAFPSSYFLSNLSHICALLNEHLQKWLIGWIRTKATYRLDTNIKNRFYDYFKSNVNLLGFFFTCVGIVTDPIDAQHTPVQDRATRRKCTVCSFNLIQQLT